MASQAADGSPSCGGHDIRALIAEPLQLVLDPRYRNVRFNIAIDPYLPEILGEKSQIQGEITALVGDALAALEDGAAGVITLSARYDGNAVQISVTGSGATEAVTTLPVARPPYTQAHFSSFP